MEHKRLKKIATLLRKIGYRSVSFNRSSRLDVDQLRGLVSKCNQYEYDSESEPESDYVLAWFQILCQLASAAQDGQFAIVEEACHVIEPFPSGIIANNKELQELIDKLIVEVFGYVVEREMPDSVALYDQADASLSLLVCSFRHESPEVFCICMDRVSKLSNQTYRCALLLQIAHIMCENLTIVRSLLKHSSSKINDALNDYFSSSVIRKLNCGKHPQTRIGWLESRVSKLIMGFPWDKYPFADA